ncbi:MAG: hypothetical protein A4E45_02227 [Methanosaeta sp. PtaB.Bin039]|nr:MAG: hypothetical protein A4E45_02227 [Methanosaeta sp. PtaB.Bin039]OPY44107.1 MAG: hypothetical protein A4E47_01738 [Methanosaeta sp. PtaU1.Bin028]HOT06056.1 hypothetical protein [Methanotrichaceae archaeon]HQF16294.1 hypothetical protein [Methanotrichaceae archaeon]HQI90066.1 hypothetical protein [Methanotrichaceae archaeon]
MAELNLANVLREERKKAELQPLDLDFYRQVAEHISALEDDLSRLEDHFGVEAQIVEDELKSSRKSASKLMDIRMKKLTKRALRRASSSQQGDDRSGLTQEEAEIYESLLSAASRGRQRIMDTLAGKGTERPLTGKRDIGQEYTTVRLLDSVPMFIGVDGRRYLLSRDDVVMLPAIHARNLCSRGLAQEISMR